MKKHSYYKSVTDRYPNYTRDDIRIFFQNKLRYDKSTQLSALLLINQKQTSDELHKKRTIYVNDYGWNQSDAHRMSRIAKKYYEGLVFNTGPKSVGLTRDHYKVLSKVLPKYWSQYALLSDNDYYRELKSYYGD